MTHIIITKAQFLDWYEQDKLYDILVTPIAIIAKTKPNKDDPQQVVVVNID